MQGVIFVFEYILKAEEGIIAKSTEKHGFFCEKGNGMK